MAIRLGLISRGSGLILAIYIDRETMLHVHIIYRLAYSHICSVPTAPHRHVCSY